MTATATLPARRLAGLTALVMSPVVIIFVSSNFVNAGNLAFNIIFSRWMGPELFGTLAALLTIKLALLGILGALQMAVSQHVAATDVAGRPALGRALAWVNRTCFIALFIALPMIAAIIWSGSVGERLGLGSSSLLLILMVSLPFTAPLSILRGVAMGRLDAKAIVVSANVEMAIRLGLGILAWTLGLGIEGVVASVALSIVAGWFVIRGVLPTVSKGTAGYIDLSRVLASAALPFAALQAAQVVMLDGDVLLAKLCLSDAEAGYTAALSLFQRIQFFACFGLASVLLPAVAAAVSSGGSILRAILPAAGLYLAVSLSVLAGVIVEPKLLVTLMVGPQFAPVAGYLWLAAASAIGFTFSFLVATFLAAIGSRKGIWMIVFTVPVQITAMMQADGLAQILVAKFATQTVLAAVLAIVAAGHVLKKVQRTSRTCK